MKKQIFRKAIALTTALTLAVGLTMSAHAAGAGTTDLEGDSTVKNPVYNVIVPTTIDFAIDAFEQTGKGQIAGGDYAIINQSNIPVSVKISAILDSASGVTVTTQELVNTASSGTTNTAKLASLAMVPLKTAPTLNDTLDGLNTDTEDSGTKPVYSTDVLAVLGTPTEDLTAGDTEAKAAALTTSLNNGAKLNFALGGVVYANAETDNTWEVTDGLATGNKGVTAFTFTGRVNTNATWAASDIKVKLRLDIKGIGATAYAALTYVTDTMNLVTNGAVNATNAPGAEAAPSFTDTTKTMSSSADVTYAYNLGAGDLAATAITSIIYQDGTTSFLNDTYTDVSSSGSLVIKAAVYALSPGTHTFTVTFNDTATTAEVITLIIE